MRQYICITHAVCGDDVSPAWEERGTLDQIKAFVDHTALLAKRTNFYYRHVIVELPEFVDNAWDATPNQKTYHGNRMCRAHSHAGETLYTTIL